MSLRLWRRSPLTPLLLFPLFALIPAAVPAAEPADNKPAPKPADAALKAASALFDGILYLCVGDAIVCYRCGAHHSCASAGAAHQPFELIVAERYRQERLRRERWGQDQPQR